MPLLALSVSVACAELSLEDLRGKFEAALEAEELERGVKVIKLKEGYVDAMERLISTLGREDKLESASQVLREIEAVKSGIELRDAPHNADYRFKTLRAKWDGEIERLTEAYRKEVAELAGKYEKVLTDRQRSLTKLGKIKEALMVRDEISQLAIRYGNEQTSPDDLDPEKDDKVEIVGSEWVFLLSGNKDMGVIKFKSSTRVAFSWRSGDEITWEKERSRTLILTDRSVATSKQFVMKFDGSWKKFTLHVGKHEIGSGYRQREGSTK